MFSNRLLSFEQHVVALTLRLRQANDKVYDLLHQKHKNKGVTVKMFSDKVDKESQLLREMDIIAFETHGQVYLAKIQKVYPLELLLPSPVLCKPIPLCQHCPCPLESLKQQIVQTPEQQKDTHHKLSDQPMNDSQILNENKEENNFSTKVQSLPQEQQAKTRIDGHGFPIQLKHQRLPKQTYQTPCTQVSIDLYVCQPNGNLTTSVINFKETIVGQYS